MGVAWRRACLADALAIESRDLHPARHARDCDSRGRITARSTAMAAGGADDHGRLRSRALCVRTVARRSAFRTRPGRLFQFQPLAEDHLRLRPARVVRLLPAAERSASAARRSDSECERRATGGDAALPTRRRGDHSRRPRVHSHPAHSAARARDVGPRGTLRRADSMSGYLVQLILPVYDNDGAPIGRALFAQVRRELTERFGGVTAYTRAPAEGMWESSAVPSADRHRPCIDVRIVTLASARSCADRTP